MKAYILAIAGAVLLSAVISIISPSGKMGKFIKGALKILILVVLITPFATWLGGKEFTISANRIETDSAYLEYCAGKLAEEDEKEISAYLESEFSVTAEVSVTRGTESNFRYEKILIKISDFGIIGQDERIDIMTRIKEAVGQKYGCYTEVA